MSTTQTEFADPITAAYYGLCIYDGGNNLIGTMDVPPSSKWSAISDKGYKYFDLNADEDGAFKIKLKGSTQPKSKALVKGRGRAAARSAQHDTARAAGEGPAGQQCQRASASRPSYGTAKLNTETKFKAKFP